MNGLNISVNRVSSDHSKSILPLPNSKVIAESSVQAFVSHCSDTPEIGILIYNE